jgi:capsular exopolysaccharide synthesis family protein
MDKVRGAIKAVASTVDADLAEPKIGAVPGEAPLVLRFRRAPHLRARREQQPDGAPNLEAQSLSAEPSEIEPYGEPEGKAPQPETDTEWQDPGPRVEPEPVAPSALKHRFDELKIHFLARYAGDSVKSVLIIGSARGDGASTVAYNFAASLAQDADVRVLLINADMRTPTRSASRIDASPTPGLAVLARAETDAPVPARRGNLHVLPSGRGHVDPAVLFQSKRFDAFMAQVCQQFDFVVVDGPPLEGGPEAIALSAKLDGVILVIDAQHTRRKTALRTKQRIEEVGGRVLGVVLNRRRYFVPRWLYEKI